mmetsp:Transcript_70446/g.177602  ORF Transcript_70446/g.177602 Transcript_70446/m.177602 type:complete len:176 (+) Transcript_70446:109-636(+)
MVAYPPGVFVRPGMPGYGEGPGYFHEEEETYRGQTTMIVGGIICFCTCCPCGFLLPLDKKKTRVWVVGSQPVGQTPAQVVMMPQTAVPAQTVGAVPAQTVVATAVPAQAVMQPEGVQTEPMQTITVKCSGTCGQMVQVQVPVSGRMVSFDGPCGAKNQVCAPSGNAKQGNAMQTE